MEKYISLIKDSKKKRNWFFILLFGLGGLVLTGIILLPANAHKTVTITNTKITDPATQNYQKTEFYSGFVNYGHIYIESYTNGDLTDYQLVDGNVDKLSFSDYLKIINASFKIEQNALEQTVVTNQNIVNDTTGSYSATEKANAKINLDEANFDLSQVKTARGSFNSSDASLKVGASFIGLFTIPFAFLTYLYFMLRRAQ